MIGFIGSGQMARALAAGFVQQGGLLGEEICFTNPGDENAASFLAAVPAAKRLPDAAAVVKQSAQVWLAVKPQVLPHVLPALRGNFHHDQVVVSVVAGMTLATLRDGTQHTKLIRVSPSTPCLIGQGISVLAVASDVQGAERDHVVSLLQTVGSAWEVDERLIDPLSGLTSCGPAFVMTIIEALADGAVRAGVPRAMANTLVLELLAGSTELARQSPLHPAQLREQVASPAGSTMAGLAALEQGGLRAALSNAVVASAHRAAELGRLSPQP